MGLNDFITKWNKFMKYKIGDTIKVNKDGKEIEVKVIRVEKDAVILAENEVWYKWNTDKKIWVRS